jgi:transcriptional regulator with PAS, ATPase and Fis domain
MRILGTSVAIRAVEAQLGRIAATDSSVLITGETGTGKELVAAAIHERSRRCKRPFLVVNCAAIPNELIESELFGHERGAYTGAVGAFPGKFKLADGGSLFLDELAEMSDHAQAKLLRAIETRTVWRVGGTCGVPIDVRFIAATNREVDGASGTSFLRSDLYYRLSVVRLHMPPLREIGDDIPLLLNAFVGEYNARFERAVAGFAPEVEWLCSAYDWPGNIRELRNFVEATFVFSPANRFALAELPPPWRARQGTTGELRSSDRTRLLAALAQARGNKTRAARDLQCSRMTLYRKLQKYQLDRARSAGPPKSRSETPAAT